MKKWRCHPFFTMDKDLQKDKNHTNDQRIAKRCHTARSLIAHALIKGVNLKCCEARKILLISTKVLRICGGDLLFKFWEIRSTLSLLDDPQKAAKMTERGDQNRFDKKANNKNAYNPEQAAADYKSRMLGHEVWRAQRRQSGPDWPCCECGQVFRLQGMEWTEWKALDPQNHV